MDAANYLFTTGGVRWALDPLRPNRVLHDLPVDVPVEPLKALSFVLLTHNHSGHRGCAHQPEPPLIDAFCDFMLGCEPRAITLAHFYEFSRPHSDLWHRRHLEMVRQRWRQRGLSIPVRVPAVGEGETL
jgi:hypothetical protein